MNLLVSLLITTFCLYVVFFQIRAYNELVCKKYRFRYFALRDRLAMLVVSGRLREDSWEFNQIVTTINFHISAIETMSIIRIVEMLIEFHSSKEEERQVEKLHKKIDSIEVATIVADFMSTTYDLLKRNSRVQIACIRLGKRVLGSGARIRHEVFSNPNPALHALNTNRVSFRQDAQIGFV